MGIYYTQENDPSRLGGTEINNNEVWIEAKVKACIGEDEPNRGKVVLLSLTR